MKVHEQMKLSDVCHVYQPETVSKKSLPLDGIYPVYGANGKIGLHHQFNHEDSQLLLGCRGSVGSVHISEPKSWINGNAMVVKPFENVVTRDYLKYAFLGGISLKPAITGTAQPQITRESISKILIPVPPLADQEKLVKKLDSIFSELNILEQNLNLQMKESAELYKSACREKTNNLNPRGVRRLKELAILITKGTTPTSLGYKFHSQGVNFLKVESLDSKGGFVREKFAYIDDLCNENFKRSQLQANDVLVSIAGALGRTALVTSDLCPANVNQALALIRLASDSEVSHMFLFSLFQAGYFDVELNQMGAGAAQQNLSLAQIGSLEVPIFPFEKQQEFIDFLFALRAQIIGLQLNLEAQKELASSLKASILSGVFSNNLQTEMAS